MEIAPLSRNSRRLVDKYNLLFHQMNVAAVYLIIFFPHSSSHSLRLPLFLRALFFFIRLACIGHQLAKCQTMNLNAVCLRQQLVYNQIFCPTPKIGKRQAKL